MKSLKDVAHVAGKSGLYHIVKPGRSGVIVETMDAKKEKTMLGATARVSILKDISIFMADGAEAMPLADILTNIHTHYQDQTLDSKALSDYKLVDFMALVTPGYDTDRVYLSDIRKIINWYNILKNNMPQVFEPEVEEITDETAAEV
jgi:Domain of unknown function (DUF5606)